MIDIKVGKVERTPDLPRRGEERGESGLVGRIVSAHAGRGTSAVRAVIQKQKRRGGETSRDPSGSRVLTIVVADGATLPSDKELQNKRVVLRIVD